MRYLCVHCDVRFEHQGEDKPRCPECMRVHGIEKVAEPQGAAPRRLSARQRRWVAAGAGALVLAALGSGYAWWATRAPDVSGDPPLKPLSQATLDAYLDKEKVEAGELADLLVADEAIASFAEQAAGDADGSSAGALAEAVVAALRERAQADAFVPWSLAAPRGRGLETAAAAYARIAEDGARAKLYPLETAAIAVSALRTLGVDAMVAEAWAFPAEQAPPDPSGRFGYYMVAIWPKQVGKGDPTLLDSWAGRDEGPKKDAYRTLTDVQAVAAALHHQALHLLANRGDTSRAYDLSENALALDPRSPPGRTVRGAVLLQTGGIQEGAKELRSALQMRSDAPRHKNLAELYFAQGNVGKASRQLSKALEKQPDYAGAHALLAAVHLRKRETERAHAELKTAERLDPELPTLPRLWAQYYLRVGQMEKAVDKARSAIEERGHDWQTRLHAGQVFRAAGYYGEMRKQARAIMDIVPESRQTRIRKLVKRVLGPTAFDEPVTMDGGMGMEGGMAMDGGGVDLGPDSGLGGDLKLSGSQGGGLKLGQGGGPSLLGGDQGSSGPSLLDDQQGGSLTGGGSGGSKGAPLPSPGGGSKLRLKNPGQSLDLDLGGNNE